MSSIPYRPEIDGLRAVAIVAVVLFHFSPSALPGGYLGVDIFFVISGYLITSIVLADFSSGRFAMREFWARRIRRILPAAGFLVACVLLAAVMLDYPQRALSIVGRQAVASLVFVANFAMKVIAGDYWSPTSDSLVLLHHWSLAVEEQFYMIYPAVLVGLLALSRRIAGPALIVLMVASLWACLLKSQADASAAFFFPQYRAWELLAGCSLAFRRSPAPARWVAWAGLALMALAIAGGARTGSSPCLATVVAVIGAAFYIDGSTVSSTAAAWLSSPRVVALGKASYSLYLWHWPCIVMASTMAILLEKPWLHWLSIPAMAIGTSVSCAWIEPWGRRLRSPYLFAALATACLLGASAWAALNLADPKTPGVSRPAWLARAYDCVQAPPIPLIGERHVGFSLPASDINPPRKDAYLTGVLAGAPGARAQWFLLGDSHALMWANQLALHAGRQGKTLRVYAGIGLSPLLVESAGAGLDRRSRAEFNAARMERIAAERPELILVAMRWDYAVKAGLSPKVEELVAAVRSASPGARILLLSQPPVARMSVNAPQWVAWRSSWGAPVKSAPMADSPFVAAGREMLSSLASRIDGVVVWDPSPLLQVGGRVRIVEGMDILYRDDDHLSEQGAAWVFHSLAREVH